ncbi:MAG: helix-turn-helix domain-containing protein [Vicinamibacteria bacterium]
MLETAEKSRLDVVRELDRASVLLNPLRLRIVRELREADSASGLSRKLGLPRQKLNYHLRELESSGFLELVAERRKGNCTERFLRATARSYLVDPAALGEVSLDPDAFTDHFSSSYLLALAGKTIRDIAVLRDRADKAGKKLPTLSLESEVRFASAERQAAFAEDLTRKLQRLVAKYHDDEAPSGRRFRIVLASYPKLRPEGGSR